MCEAQGLGVQERVKEGRKEWGPCNSGKKHPKTWLRPAGEGQLHALSPSLLCCPTQHLSFRGHRMDPKGII